MVKRSSRQRGFTLIELMVVVAIVGVLSAILFGVSGRKFGGNATTTSAQLSATLSLTKSRAVASRRIHMVEILPTEIRVWQSNTLGFTTPTAYSFVEKLTLPTRVVIYDVLTTVETGTGTTVTQNGSLAHNMFFRPDGSSSGGTIFITDEKPQQHRVLVYKATGGVRVRDLW